ncbi:hypothetical protein [Methylobacterium sp. 77]|uniref:hypothetical protein n=1 Tax=Methylobacterium sp. 77 TaxID=1101192 RepID=UPI0003613661|nr:hypothetical protein [Methylobacterium sp. 77]
MAGSKLERYRDANFPEEVDEDVHRSSGQAAASSRSDPARSERPSRRSKRGVFGRAYLGFKLILTLGPLAFLLLSVFAECGPRASSIMPNFVREAACARRDLTRHAVSIGGALKAVADRIR